MSTRMRPLEAVRPSISSLAYRRRDTRRLPRRAGSSPFAKGGPTGRASQDVACLLIAPSQEDEVMAMR